MIRVIKLGNQFYGKEIDFDEDLKKEISDIKEFISQGETVILVDELSNLETIGIMSSDVIMVQEC